MEKALTGDYKAKCTLDLPEHFVAEVEYKEWSEANKYSNYPGAKRSGLKSISFESSDYVEVLRFIMFCL